MTRNLRKRNLPLQAHRARRLGRPLGPRKLLRWCRHGKRRAGRPPDSRRDAGATGVTRVTFTTLELIEDRWIDCLMPDFLLEIGCEEVPARMLDAGAQDLRDRVSKLLERERLAPQVEVTQFETPRRL